MRTGLTKKQKTTVIYFDEHSRIIEVQTHNTDLKKRLTAFAAKYPECCRQTNDDEQGGLTFEIEKGRLSFRLTAPYSKERRRAASEQAKQNGIHKKVADLP
jgi:phage terminase Nu1 subunit (DNA packaging protein)